MVYEMYVMMYVIFVKSSYIVVDVDANFVFV